MKTVFLDLDGTLTDPKLGTTRSVRHALLAMGMEVPQEDDLEWVIGPPLLDSFRTLGVPDPAQALALYRERYATVGLFENQVYDGIPEALEQLQAAGMSLCLATAKPHTYARQITSRFGLAKFLDHQFGPELDGTRNDKGELLAFALELTGSKAPDCIMVGDRHHDTRAAKSVGMRSIWVSWGYGPGEGVGADRQVTDPDALVEAVLSLIYRD